MEIASNILQVIGFIMAIVGGIAVLIKMFQVNILWGLCGLFIPIASWAFLAMHWDKAKNPCWFRTRGRRYAHD